MPITRSIQALRGRGPGLPFSAVSLLLAAGICLAVAGLVSCDRRDPAPAVVAADEPVIRVRILRRAERATLDAPGGELMITRLCDAQGGDGDGSAERSRPASPISGPVTLAVREGQLAVTPAAGGATLLAQAIEFRSTSGLLAVDQKRHTGPVQVRAREGRLEAVVLLPVESYLAGVLAGELYASWPDAAFEAQAVAARSYALHERGRARSRGRWHDIEAGTTDQAYAGDTALSRAHAATDRTRGWVLLEGTEVLRAYYSSTCGGRACSAADIWPADGSMAFNAAGPLQGHAGDCPCQASPLWRWTRRRSVDELQTRLSAWGRQAGHPLGRVGSPTGIEPATTNTFGRPVGYVVRDAAGGSFRLTADELRVAVNHSSRGLGTAKGDHRVPSNDLAFAFDRGAVTITGRGFGHGVGLCQWGTRGLAEQGEGWRDIVGHYYPGARLGRLW